MKKFIKSLTRQDGFTLVELMVVVAIIGLLSAVAVPNFRKYQAKAKTTEAKLQLAAAYTALQSFYSDYEAYGVCLSYMGYNPSNEISQRYYVTGYDAAATATATATSVYISNGASATGCTNTAAQANQTYFAAGKKTGNTAALTLANFTAANIGIAATQPSDLTFTIAAMGIIDTNFATANGGVTNGPSSFTMDQNKNLVQIRSGY